MTISANATTMMTLPAVNLDAVPQEVLEQIAFFAATEPFLGPPQISSLLTSSHRIYSLLSVHTNYVFHARVFAEKFDLGSLTRRLGPARTESSVLAKELCRRWLIIKRIRNRSHSITTPGASQENLNLLREDLFEVYFMVLENEGKNARQLLEYAQIDQWLWEYLFHEAGASQLLACLQAGRWPSETQETALAMWIFWLMFRPDHFNNRGDAVIRNVNTVLKSIATAAHKYLLTDYIWTEFVTPSRRDPSGYFLYYSQPCRVPPLAIPAILAFTSLRTASSVGNSYPILPPPPEGHISHSLEWESEWRQCLNLGNSQPQMFSHLSRRGIAEGVWEGLFMYTEFSEYRDLLDGGSPVLLKSHPSRQRQNLKLREHHLVISDASSDPSPGRGVELESATPMLPVGDPLSAFFPIGTRIMEDKKGIQVFRPSTRDIVRYQRFRNHGADFEGPETSVRDIIITGEGHSSWGQFSLVGRIRPCDGLICLLKEYTGGERGKWLYRGYIVGNADGCFVGRWRDVFSPVQHNGYEGCFAVRRRK